MSELNWGLPVILYLFLGGLGAGAGTVSASILLRGSHTTPNEGFDLVRWGALLAPVTVIVGTGLIIFELGTFQAGHWFKWTNLFMTINMSPMSLGSWLLGVFILVSLVYAYTFLGRDVALNDTRQGLRKGLAMLVAPLGIGVALYTGIMLGATPARPFWNSPVLALLFLVSALSTGVAAILLARAVFGTRKHDKEHPDRVGFVMTSSDVLLIAFEVLIVALFLLFAQLTFSHVGSAFGVILGGGMSTLFWFGFVVLGLLVPVLIELRYVYPALREGGRFSMPRGAEVLIAALVLAGGFILRYVVVVAGQMTGPVGL